MQLSVPVTAFYPRLAVYSVSEGTVSVFGNFLHSCRYAFYKCNAVIRTKLLSNLISEGPPVKFSPRLPSSLPFLCVLCS